MFAQLFLLNFGLYHIIPARAKREPVESCPRGQQRIERQSNLCVKATFYHCIPDATCQLYQFCADPQKSPQIVIPFISKDKKINETVIIPSTNTELYRDLTLYFCQYYSGVISDNKLLEDIIKRLDTKILNIYTQRCTSPDDEHVLPTFGSCEIGSNCFQIGKVMTFKLFIFHNKTLISQDVKMGLSNGSDVHKVRILLCVFNKSKLYEYKFDKNSNPNGTIASDEVLTYIGIIVGLLEFFLAPFITFYFVRRKPRQEDDINIVT